MRALATALLLVAGSFVAGSFVAPQATLAATTVPAQCAYAQHWGRLWSFVNRCDYAVQWVVSCQVADRFCGTSFDVFVAPGGTQQGHIAQPDVMVLGPYYAS